MSRVLDGEKLVVNVNVTRNHFPTWTGGKIREWCEWEENSLMLLFWLNTILLLVCRGDFFTGNYTSEKYIEMTILLSDRSVYDLK